MYESLRGKKLLVIGSEETDCCIVRTAQEMGIYVIAGDGTVTSPKTKAKVLADESWDLDYRETERYAEKCRQAHVDGVIAGYSENRVLAACRIANQIHTPFYANEEQIDLTRNKRKFKAACEKSGVRVPKEYCLNGVPSGEELDAVRLPVIVKPSDSAGRKGITICRNREELAPAVERALKESFAGTVVVEEYIEGTEFSAVYTAQEGRYSLSYFCEKYLNPALPKSGLCDLSLTPSDYLDGFLDECDAPLKRMMQSIGIRDGVAYYQGIVNENGYWIFEMGYRLNGGNDCVQIERYNGVNYLKMLIAHSLTGKMLGDQQKDQPRFPVFFGVFYLYAKGGEVAEICYTGDPEKTGVEEVGIYRVPGSVIKADGTTLQRVFRFKLCASSREELKELIAYAQDHARILDTNGEDMILCRFEPERIG